MIEWYIIFVFATSQMEFIDLPYPERSICERVGQTVAEQSNLIDYYCIPYGVDQQAIEHVLLQELS